MPAELTAPTSRLLALPAACLLALTLAACGGGGDEAADDADLPERTAEDRSARSEDEVDLSESTLPLDSGSKADPPTFQLTGPLEVPEGWQEVAARCTTSESTGPPYFTYAVPGDWSNSGGGAAGSGAIGGSGDHRWSLPSGSSVHVKVESDNYDHTGQVLGEGNEPWQSWDYEVTYYGSDGERTFEAVYEERDPVTIDGEAFDLWFLEGQESDGSTNWSTEWKVRAVIAEVPDFDGNRRPYSATITVIWDDEPDEDVVTSVIETFRVPECTQEEITGTLELIIGSDWSDD